MSHSLFRSFCCESCRVVSRSRSEETVVRDELAVDGVLSTGRARDVEFGERDEDDDVIAGDCSAWE